MTTAVTPKQWHGLAVLMACAANFTLAIMNAAVKWLTLQGYSTFQITFTNGCIGLTTLVAWMAATGNLPKVKTKEPLLLAYVAVSLVTCYCLFSAYGMGKIAEVSTVVASAPRMIAPLSYIFLHERMTKRQALLAVFGFLGVLLVLKPRPDIGDYQPLLLALGGAFAFSLSQIFVKKLTGRVYTLAFTFYFYSALIVIAGALAHFTPVTLQALPVFALSGACDVTSLVLLYTAYHHAPASLVAPFNYSNILWTALFGYILWAETLDAWTLAGAACIVAAGIAFARTMFGKKEQDAARQ